LSISGGGLKTMPPEEKEKEKQLKHICVALATGLS
jgi:hypothetical protein